MFGKPKFGWTIIDIGEYHGDGSYLTDIPFDFLEAAIYSLSNNAPLALFIDEEGTDSYITSYYGTTIVNRVASGIATYYMAQDFKDIIEEGVADIEENVGEWASFACFDEDEEIVEFRVRELKKMISKVKEYL